MINFVGRNEEIKSLRKYDASEKSEFVAVYGRRRVGKTYLLQYAFHGQFDFEYTGLYHVGAKEQRKRFQDILNLASGKQEATPEDWFSAFDRLKQYLLAQQKEKVTVFLDELPWMDTQKSNFMAALSGFWNGWKSHECILKLYVCGSATTWMLDKLIGDRGGLHGRITRSIYLAPFTLRETEEYLNQVKHMHYGQRQVLETYMVFGGIPYYLDMLDREYPLSENVDRLFFFPNAPLKTEYDFLFRSLYKSPLNYQKVIEALASTLRGMTREEISDASGIDGGELTQVLKNLEACDFIRSYLFPKKTTRAKTYQLIDMFCLFSLRFVQQQKNSDIHFWTKSARSGYRNAWAGYAFEQTCLSHVQQIKEKLGISGILSGVYAWSSRAFTDKDGNEWKGGQIDLVIDRNDHVINLCEMKYSQTEYAIDGDYAEKIQNRMELFRKVQRTKKELHCTFVTLYGVKNNNYIDIVNEQVKMEDLFG